jgi:kynureninase
MLESLATQASLQIGSVEFAKYLDENDELREIKSEFLFPKVEVDGKSSDSLYLCGNSLGIQPRRTRDKIIEQLDKWAAEGVEGHFTEPTPWLTIDDMVVDSLARLVGALPSEVVMMNSLTVNLHLMMVAFYRPTETRHKILIEKKAFPSDIHAVVSQIIHHNFDPSTSLVEVGPRDGESTIRIEDIEAVISEQGESIALVLFSGVQYYTGQLFPMDRISAAAKAKGCNVGFDLAHAVGNVPLRLHDWGCDFACWCSYKYLNCGPGSIAGCFVHERHGRSSSSGASSSASEGNGGDSNTNSSDSASGALAPPRFCGWWGHRLEDRFVMAPDFIPAEGAYGYRLSNPPVLLVAGARASLDLFDQVRIFCNYCHQVKNICTSLTMCTSIISFQCIYSIILFPLSSAVY